MSEDVSKPIAVLYEHAEWFQPLFAELDRRSVPVVHLRAQEHGFDPAEETVPYSLVVNRMSPSAYLRGAGNAIHYTRQFLAHLKSVGAPVVNGLEAYELEISKASQLDLLRRLGLRYPNSRVVNHARLVPQAAQDLKFPVAVKPNIGGSGAKIQRFQDAVELRRAVDEDRLDMGLDHTVLVQEFLPARDRQIVRVEFLDGEFLYAIRIHLQEDGDFNLCPADICRTSPHLTPNRSIVEIDPAQSKLRVENHQPPDSVIEEVLSIAGAAGLDVGGIEYLVSDRDGEIYYYDINSLSNFVTNAVSVVGFDPHARFVEYLLRRMQLFRQN